MGKGLQERPPLAGGFNHPDILLLREPSAFLQLLLHLLPMLSQQLEPSAAARFPLELHSSYPLFRAQILMVQPWQAPAAAASGAAGIGGHPVQSARSTAAPRWPLLRAQRETTWGSGSRRCACGSGWRSRQQLRCPGGSSYRGLRKGRANYRLGLGLSWKQIDH